MEQTLQTFLDSVKDGSPPINSVPLLHAVWHGLRGEWDAAHKIAQDDASADGAWVHAWLHRIEGDLSNAGYWYRRAHPRSLRTIPRWKDGKSPRHFCRVDRHYTFTGIAESPPGPSGPHSCATALRNDVSSCLRAGEIRSNRCCTAFRSCPAMASFGRGLSMVA
jgi:hypothetical protein